MAMPVHSTQSEGNVLTRFVLAVLAFVVSGYVRFAGHIGALILGAYVLISAASVVIQPDENWDMLPYVAMAGESSFGGDAVAVHQFAYDAVKDGVSAADYLALTTGDTYREHMSKSPEDFVSMLGMYRVKILYGIALKALFPILSPVQAVKAISIGSMLAFGLFALLWLRQLRALALGPLVMAAMMLIGVGGAARAGTPDMLSAALMLGGMLAFVQKREMVSAVLLFLAFLARTDNIIFLCLFALLIVVFQVKARGALVAFVASFVAYFLISKWAGHPGWWPHLYFSTVSQELNMNGFDPDFSIAVYARTFAKALFLSLIGESWCGFTILTVGLWLTTHVCGFKLQMREGVAFAALSLSLAAKFVVFPIHDTRVYLPALLPLLMLVMPALLAFGQAAIEKAKQNPAAIST
jgi:hypothetical protein